LIPGSSSLVAMVLISIVTFAHMAWKTNLMTLTNDIYPLNVVGSVAGIIAFGSGIGSTLFTNLTGQVVQYYSYTAIFIMMGFMHPLALVIVSALVKNVDDAQTG
jgi:ACS family hexuronate transporter-like MFS transporter